MDDASKRTGKYSQRPPMPDAKQRGRGESEIAGQARNDKDRQQ